MSFDPNSRSGSRSTAGYETARICGICPNCTPCRAARAVTVSAGTFGSARRLTPDLQPPARLASAAAIPIAHGGVAVFIEAFELESLVVELLELGEIEPEARSSGRDPIGFAVDDNQISVAARSGIGPPRLRAAASDLSGIAPPIPAPWCRWRFDVGEGDVSGRNRRSSPT